MGRKGWQGRPSGRDFVSEQSDGYYLVQLFEWVLGEPSTQKVVHIGSMADWEFYSSSDEMNDAYERRTGRPWKSILTTIAEAKAQAKTKSD